MNILVVLLVVGMYGSSLREFSVYKVVAYINELHASCTCSTGLLDFEWLPVCLNRHPHVQELCLVLRNKLSHYKFKMKFAT